MQILRLSGFKNEQPKSQSFLDIISLPEILLHMVEGSFFNLRLMRSFKDEKFSSYFFSTQNRREFSLGHFFNGRSFEGDDGMKH